MNIRLIVAETDRSFFYLKKLLKENIKISSIIYYSKQKNKTYNLIKKRNLDIKTRFIFTDNINDKKILKCINEIKINQLNIFSGYLGEIVKSETLIKKKLIHCHSGDLPFFKGSTTIYYTLLKKKKICVSLIYLNKNIDEGKILFKKFFIPPKNKKNLEKNFDNEIRAEALVKFLKTNKVKPNNKFRNIKKIGYNYYIAHPMIRYLVINKRSFMKKFLNKYIK